MALRLARVAVAYAQAVAAGSTSPSRDLAVATGYDRHYVRHLIQEARRCGYLTKAPAHGVAGGEATAEACELLAREAAD